MKVENLYSLEATEHVMVRWMCGLLTLLLKDRKRIKYLNSLLGNQSVAYVVRHGRLRWFGYFEHKNVDDWVSACRSVEVTVVKRESKDRKTW